MEVMYSISLYIILIALIFILIIAAESGFYFGSLIKKKYLALTKKTSDIVPTSLLGLLALLMGFTFSMAITRYEQRNTLMLKYSNAIGTTYLRSQLLPQPFSEQVSKDVMSYLDNQVHILATYHGMFLGDPLSQELENRIWYKTTQLARQFKDPITATFIQTLNEMIDLRSEIIFAANNHVPESIFFVIALVALIIVFIQDLDRPGRGIVKVQHKSLILLKQSTTK